jgi:hypothetical protein
MSKTLKQLEDELKTICVRMACLKEDITIKTTEHYRFTERYE